jgi:hypothetical protein
MYSHQVHEYITSKITIDDAALLMAKKAHVHPFLHHWYILELQKLYHKDKLTLIPVGLLQWYSVKMKIAL